MRYGIMGEDRSDVDALKIIIKRLADQYSLDTPAFHQKGYQGWAEMFVKGAAQLKLFERLRCNKIVICFDADGPQEKAHTRREKIRNELILPSQINVSISCFALVPVQELEAWILADLHAVKKIITSFKLPKPFSSPERIASPKERLMKISRCPTTRKARYCPAKDNERAAKYLDFRLVETKCPSFCGFVDFVTGKSLEDRVGVKRRQRRRRR